MRCARLVVGGRSTKHDDILGATSESTVLTLAYKQWAVVNVESHPSYRILRKLCIVHNTAIESHLLFRFLYNVYKKIL